MVLDVDEEGVAFLSTEAVVGVYQPRVVSEFILPTCSADETELTPPPPAEERQGEVKGEGNLVVVKRVKKLSN